jgi:3-oxoacyl-[acyl-carrier-protein] synthase-3
MFSEFENIRIAGVATAVPKNQVDNLDYVGVFSEKEIKKQIKVTGIQKRRVLREDQPYSDLNYAVVDEVLLATGWEGNEVDAIIYVSAYNHQASPSTAFQLLQHIGAEKEAVGFDMNLGCSGFIIGLYMMSSLLYNQGNGKKGIVVLSDNSTAGGSDYDRAISMLPGDCATATAIEVVPDQRMNIQWFFDGSRYDFLHRMSLEQTMQMDGMAVFQFGITDVADSIQNYFAHYDLNPDDCDFIVLHQAQKLMVTRVGQFGKLPKEKLLTSYNLFGNTGGPSLPCTLCANTEKYKGMKNIKVFFAGFGSGLSWGMVILDIDTECIRPVVYVE